MLKALKNKLMKIKQFYHIIKNDEDWDYHFMLDLIEFKLERMANYFFTHNIVENEYRYGNQCLTAIKILNAGYNTQIITDKDLGDIYVNSKNARRFLSKEQFSDYIKYPDIHKKYFLATIREEKAKKLFWKYLEHYIEYWWD